MRKFLRGAISLLLAAALSIPMFSMAAFAEEVPTVELPVKVELTGSKPSTAEELVVVLTAKDAACPMPEGSVDGVYRLSVTGGGDKKLPVIAFPSLGIYHYTIHQEPGTNSKGTYDKTVYNMVVYVVNSEKGGLEAQAKVYVDVEKPMDKAKDVAFTNDYKKTTGGGTPPGGGDSGRPDPDPKPSTVIPTDPVPQAPGPIEIIEELIPEGVPLAVLPKTGDGSISLVTLAALMAVSGMLVVGLLRKRRKEENS